MRYTKVLLGLFDYVIFMEKMVEGIRKAEEHYETGEQHDETVLSLYNMTCDGK